MLPDPQMGRVRNRRVTRTGGLEHRPAFIVRRHHLTDHHRRNVALPNPSLEVDLSFLARCHFDSPKGQRLRSLELGDVAADARVLRREFMIVDQEEKASDPAFLCRSESFLKKVGPLWHALTMKL